MPIYLTQNNISCADVTLQSYSFAHSFVVV